MDRRSVHALRAAGARGAGEQRKKGDGIGSYAEAPHLVAEREGGVGIVGSGEGANEGGEGDDALLRAGNCVEHLAGAAEVAAVGVGAEEGGGEGGGEAEDEGEGVERGEEAAEGGGGRVDEEVVRECCGARRRRRRRGGCK